MNRCTLRSPTLWAVMGTATIGVGGSLLASLLCQPRLISNSHYLLCGVALLVMIAGAVFYRVNAMVDLYLCKTSRLLQRKEREFMWDCHNPRTDDALLQEKYLDDRFRITAELLRSCRKAIVLPQQMSGKFIADTEIKLAPESKKILRCIIFGVLIFVLAVIMGGSYLVVTVHTPTESVVDTSGSGDVDGSALVEEKSNVLVTNFDQCAFVSTASPAESNNITPYLSGEGGPDGSE